MLLAGTDESFIVARKSSEFLLQEMQFVLNMERWSRIVGSDGCTSARPPPRTWVCGTFLYAPIPYAEPVLLMFGQRQAAAPQIIGKDGL